MGKYDKEREELGLTRSVSASSVSTGGSKYAAERERISNPAKAKVDDQSAYVEGMKNSRLMEVDALKTKQAEEKTTKDTMKTLGIDLAGNVKRFGEFKSGIDTKQKVIDDKKTADKQKLADSRADTRKNLPSGAKKILSGIDKFSDFIKPGTDIAETFVTAGGGPSAIAGLTRGAAYGVSRILPKLAGSIGGRATQTALTEGIVGAPLGLANTLTQNPEASNRELLLNTALGAGGGAILGGAGRLIGEGVEAGLRKGTQALLAPTLDNSANMAKAINDVSGENLPQTLRRTVSRDGVPEVFPDRFRRTVGGAAEAIPSPVSEVPTQQLAVNIARDVSEPRPLRTTINERGNIETQRAGNLSEEFNQGLNARDNTYERITNIESVAKANENVKNLSDAEAKFLGNKEFSAEHVATGYRLLQELDRMGETQRALNISEKLAADLTSAGQTAQAASILKRLSPEGQLLHLQRVASSAGKEISVTDAKLYTDLARDVQAGSITGKETSDFLDVLGKLKSGQEVTPDEMLKATAILEDAKKFIKSGKESPVRLPKEMKDVRTRDKVVSFLDEAEQAALARIKARKSQLNAVPLGEWADHAIVVASQIAKGTIKAETYVEDMVRLFGESVKPHVKEVYEKASKMLASSSKNISEGKINEAHDALRRLSGKASAEKEVVKSMADVVKKVIADAKKGVIEPEDLATIRTLSDEISAFPTNTRTPTAEQKFLQSVKALAKKLNDTPSEKVPTTQDNREVSSLLRQVTKLVEPEDLAITKLQTDNQHLSDIAHDLLEMKRPDPKPRTIHEKVAEKFIKESEIKPGDVEKLRDLAKQLNDLKGASAQEADMQMQAILNKYQKASWWDRIQAIRYIAMLFNTGTQLVNAASGPIMATLGYAADIGGALIDMGISKALNKPRTTTLYGSNPLRFTARWIQNAVVGGKAGARGVNPSGIAGANDIRGLTFKELSPLKPIRSTLGLLERGLGAVAKGADYATYRAVYLSEMDKIAYLDARNSGVKGRQNIKNHIEKFLLDPPAEAIERADRIGKNTTFQRSDSLGGQVANAINSGGPKVQRYVKPVVQTVFPFLRTPINIASTALDLTPVGMIKGVYKLINSADDMSRREAIRTLGLGITGTAGIGSLGYYLSSVGIITGANDSGDKDVDAIREQAGKGKYRFNISGMRRYMDAVMSGKGFEAAEKAAAYQEFDKQFDYNKLQPLAFPLAAGAALQERRARGETGVDQALGTATDAAGSLLGMSTLKGLQDIFQPQYGGTQGDKAIGIPTRLIESFLKSFSPSMLAQEARRQDPIMRKTPYNDGIEADVKGYFKSRTPGLSQSLPASKTTLGLSKLNAPGITGQYLNPYKSDIAPFTEAAQYISQLIDRTGIERLAPSAPEKKVSGINRSGVQEEITIPPKRYEKLQEDVGAEIMKQIKAIPKDLSDEAQADRVLKIYEVVRKMEMNKVKMELGIRPSK